MDKPEPDAVSDERGLHGDYPVTLESNWNLIDSQKQTIDTLTAERDELQTKLEAAETKLKITDEITKAYFSELSKAKALKVNDNEKENKDG